MNSVFSVCPEALPSSLQAVPFGESWLEPGCTGSPELKSSDIVLRSTVVMVGCRESVPWGWHPGVPLRRWRINSGRRSS